ncbi:MAG: energy transducer TonB [Chlamydiia bacterium]|nr:energy transducer TonB [Chlamydiia bacterium]
MLRLERQDEASKEVTIRLSQHEPLFNRRFIRALGLAVALHLLALGLVRLESTQSEPLLPQPVVVAELDPIGVMDFHQGTEVPLAQGGSLPHYVMAPESSVPDLPALPLKGSDWHLPYERPAHAKVDFTAVGKKPYRPDGLSLTFLEKHQPVRLSVKGALSQCTLLNDGLGGLAKPFERYDPVQQFRVIYDVQVENKTGEPYFIELSSSSGNTTLDRLARKIVRAMRFEPRSQGYMTQGRVELHMELSDALTADSMERLRGRTG